MFLELYLKLVLRLIFIPFKDVCQLVELDFKIFVFSIQFILFIFKTLNLVIFLKAYILQVLKFNFVGLIFFSLIF